MTENILIATIAAVGALVGSFLGVVMNKILVILESYWSRRRVKKKNKEVINMLQKNTILLSEKRFTLFDIFSNLVPEFAYGSWRDDLDEKLKGLLRAKHGISLRPTDEEKHLILAELYVIGLIDKEFIESDELRIKATPRFILSNFGKEIYYEIKKKY